MDKLKKAQLEFLDWEVGAFLHYGIRTFNEEHRDWDMKPMDPVTFDPSEQDCESWIKQLLAAGVKYTVLTSKHHDGFAMWQSAVTEYSVKNSSYKNGRGDVVREYTDACRKYGMKCGIYYSCAQFGSDKLEGKEYENFVVAQVTELLSNYGKIDYLWFDGCGSEGQEFDDGRIAAVIKELQPDILVFGHWGKCVRWIGNEWGAASLRNPDTAGENAEFMPGECDCCVTRNQWENFWFYNETHKECVRTPEEMLGLYYLSVGRGSNLLINIAPDRRGLLPEENVKLVSDMISEMRRRLVDCRIPSSEVRKDGEKFVISLDEYSLVDHIVIEEDQEADVKINSFDVYVSEIDGYNNNSFMLYRGCTVGRRAIITFPAVRARNIFVVVNGTGEEKIRSISASYAGGKQIKQIY